MGDSTCSSNYSSEAVCNDKRFGTVLGINSNDLICFLKTWKGVNVLGIYSMTVMVSASMRPATNVTIVKMSQLTVSMAWLTTSTGGANIEPLKLDTRSTTSASVLGASDAMSLTRPV